MATKFRKSIKVAPGVKLNINKNSVEYESLPKASFFDRWEDNPRDCNKLVYALLALILGVFGAQKFYQGKTKTGMKYLVFCWTCVPFIIGFFEGYYYLFQILFVAIKILLNKKNENTN
ncbi:MAG: NINE protein [Peptostreptococcaceae bacterium]|nr:NINE protein [Peptostreptococcaceae bacterium]